MQHFLNSAAGSADARIIAPEFLEELFAATHHAIVALHAALGRVALSTFATDLESYMAMAADSQPAIFVPSVEAPR